MTTKSCSNILVSKKCLDVRNYTTKFIRFERKKICQGGGSTDRRVGKGESLRESPFWRFFLPFSLARCQEEEDESLFLFFSPDMRTGGGEREGGRLSWMENVLGERKKKEGRKRAANGRRRSKRLEEEEEEEKTSKSVR